MRGKRVAQRGSEPGGNLGPIVTRRRFLTGLLVTIAGVAALGLRPLRDAYHRLKDPMMDDTPTGSINEGTLNTLLAATQSFVGYPIENDHYADFFRWHAETLRGYKTLYERFAAVVNRSARESRGCDFVSCSSAARRQLLEPAFSVHRVHGRLALTRIGLLERDWRLFELYIFRPIATLFASTDTWRLVGYDAWPGTPRGLERYTRPPAGAQ